MTDTSRPSTSGAAPNFGLPVRTIPMPDSPSAPAPSSALSSSSTTATTPAELAPKRGIRVRANSLGTAMMFKQNAAASSGAGPSSYRSDPPKLKTRLRSAIFKNSEAPPSPSTSVSSAQSPPVEHNGGSASVSSLPLPSSIQQTRHQGSDAGAPASRSASISSSNLRDPGTTSAPGAGAGFNRRKFFGRSNSIRSFLGGNGGGSAGGSSINRGSSHASEASSGASTAAAGAAPHPLGLLRRMGSKSFLNLNQSKPAAPNNTSSDDLSSMASVDSQASRRFSDSLKGMGRRRGKSVSKENGKSRSISSQSSSEAYTGRMIQSEMLPGCGSSRRSIESGRSSISVAFPDPQGRSSEADVPDPISPPANGNQEHQTSAPRRLTGWLYNMVGSDNTPSIEGGAPLSPVREADVLDLPPPSPTPHRNASRDTSAQDTTATHTYAGSSTNARSKAGVLLHTLANAGPGKAVRSTQATTGDNTASGSASSSHGNIAASSTGASSGNGGIAGAGGGSNNNNSNGSWVPSGVGFDRAFRFFMDTDNGGKEDEGIWLLGVWHGPRQGTKGNTRSTVGDTSESLVHAAGSDSVDQAPAGRDSEDQVAELTRAASPSSSISASSPRRTPLDLIHTSLASSSPAHDRASTPAKESSRVGSSMSTAATTSTSESLRTKSSATSFSAGPASSTSGSADVQSAFQPDFASRIWCTYRNHFAPISRDGTISDQAASAAEAAAAAQFAAATQSTSTPSTPSAGPLSSDPAQSSSPPASAGRSWLGRKVTESNAAQDSAMQANSPLGLGAALGAGYANASSSLGEKMGITNLWGRATAAAQAAGFSRAGLTTDSGWGCMLRTGQSLLANALINVHLGRSWQREPAPLRQQIFLEELASLSIGDSAEKESLQEWRERRARHATYIKILSWFLDDPSPACPFGVHRMAREGKRLGKEVGEWFGPSTAAGAIKQLVSEFPEAGIAVELAHDGVFYLDEVRAAAGASATAATSQSGGKARSSTSRKGDISTWRRPVLILIGIRLGLDSVNPIYYESVKATFSFPHSVGIAGGRPSSSYYFMGHQGNSLFYLDPHNVRPAVPLRYPPITFPAAVPRQLDIAHRFVLEDKDDEDEWWSHAYSEAQTFTFHCEKVRRMPIKSLDPSMLLGFLVKDEESLQDLCARIKALPKTIFSFAESAPKWVDDDDFDPSMESFSEPSVGEESDAEDEGKHRDIDADAAQNDRDALQRSGVSTDAKDLPVPFPGDKESGASGEMFRESRQRTAAWLGHGQPSISSSGSGRPDYSNNAASGGGAGIAFPSLDLLSPQSEGHTLQRPLRSDVRQVSTSSAATTRPARRPTDKLASTDPTTSRDLAAPLARPNKTSPTQSPARLGAGADESFSTVHLSDSEVGSAWEEVSDGGTIAPSASASAGVGAGLLRTASPMRTLVPADVPPVASAAEQAGANEGGVWTIEPSTSDNPVSPTSVVSEELVGVSLDTPSSEKPEGSIHTPQGAAAKAEGGEYFGLTSAHRPLPLPRRRSQSKPSPVDLPSTSSAGGEEVPPVPTVPATFRPKAPDMDGSDDDF
ncbi:hypothetical protein NDA16_004140 [Ustilago loliicola]|nr:hypothetical protein NDA16_004140 [Ustilago loliicola]